MNDNDTLNYLLNGDGHDTTPEGFSTAHNTQEATNGGNESANVQQEAKNTQATHTAGTNAYS